MWGALLAAAAKAMAAKGAAAGAAGAASGAAASAIPGLAGGAAAGSALPAATAGPGIMSSSISPGSISEMAGVAQNGQPGGSIPMGGGPETMSQTIAGLKNGYATEGAAQSQYQPPPELPPQTEGVGRIQPSMGQNVSIPQLQALRQQQRGPQQQAVRRKQPVQYPQGLMG